MLPHHAFPPLSTPPRSGSSTRLPAPFLHSSSAHILHTPPALTPSTSSSAPPAHVHGWFQHRFRPAPRRARGAYRSSCVLCSRVGLAHVHVLSSQTTWQPHILILQISSSITLNSSQPPCPPSHLPSCVPKTRDSLPPATRSLGQSVSYGSLSVGSTCACRAFSSSSSGGTPTIQRESVKNCHNSSDCEKHATCSTSLR